LQSVEQLAGLFRVETAVQQMLADFAKRLLDRVGIFEEGQEKGRGREPSRTVDILYEGAAAIVKVAKLPIAKGGRSALRSVLLDVLARGNWISGHYDCSWISDQFWGYPLPHCLFEAFAISGLGAKSWDYGTYIDNLQQ
jgi:hypothetical protein